MIRTIFASVLMYTLFAYAETIPPQTISCEPSLLHSCSTEKCDKIEVVNLDVVQYFEIDLEKKVLAGKIGKATVDFENILSRQGDENTFIFFGTHTDSKFDWILRIDKKSREMILLATNETLKGFIVYGTCKWETEK